ncbi:hypothetical protein GCM10011502_03260 [Oceanisphaera marina]|uniref:Copper resistance protein n=1 Tax=Oceanisphaera marina TaxID=2017550 RepID=A0ABQ1IBM4_9GAMM|nr:hypothetical protein [Oceanisphaera marina]GGB33557.1 hypothetical protein GCM10011502_03260 [Oceanisphaera marina]
MAGRRLSSRLIPRQPAWLALMLVAVVISLCLGQRMGMATSCPYSAHDSHAIQAVSDAGTQSSPISDSNKTDDNERCSLSEQLLSKVWSMLEPMLIAILVLLILWLLSPQQVRYSHRVPPPLSFAGRRRHLVLCVFRE